MTAGVPGAGIAGLFYLAGALLAPLCNLVRRARSKPSARRWSFVARLAMLALSMLAGIAVAGLLIGLALSSATALAHVPGTYANAPTAPFVIARLTVFLTLGTLVAILAGVEVLAFLASPRRVAARRARAGAPMPKGSQP